MDEMEQMLAALALQETKGKDAKQQHQPQKSLVNVTRKPLGQSRLQTQFPTEQGAAIGTQNIALHEHDDRVSPVQPITSNLLNQAAALSEPMEADGSVLEGVAEGNHKHTRTFSCPPPLAPAFSYNLRGRTKKKHAGAGLKRNRTLLTPTSMSSRAKHHMRSSKLTHNASHSVSQQQYGWPLIPTLGSNLSSNLGEHLRGTFSGSLQHIHPVTAAQSTRPRQYGSTIPNRRFRSSSPIMQRHHLGHQ